LIAVNKWDGLEKKHKERVAQELNTQANIQSKNVLDIWINIKLSELIKETTKAYDALEIDSGANLIGDFVDELSTWYVRRSRDRFKNTEDGIFAKQTLHNVLLNFAKVIAPVMPFLAEDIYLRLKGENESVHLCEWPSPIEIKGAEKEQILSEMQKAREIVSLALDARTVAGIKIRQPLATLYLKNELDERFAKIVLDEINVKNVVFDSDQEKEVSLDTVLTKELEEEGLLRDLIRAGQELRKKIGLSPKDTAQIYVSDPRFEKALSEALRANLVNAPMPEMEKIELQSIALYLGATFS